MSFVFQCNATRDALAKALYCRTVATIVRRANSLRKPLNATTMSTESTDSAHLEVRDSSPSQVVTSCLDAYHCS